MFGVDCGMPSMYVSFLTLGKLSDIAKNELNFGQLSIFGIIQ